jgi:hypothetical protein
LCQGARGSNADDKNHRSRGTWTQGQARQRVHRSEIHCMSLFFSVSAKASSAAEAAKHHSSFAGGLSGF